MKKLADLRGNMALRIMHGLTPSIMEDKPSAYSEASRLAYTLISGAREIVYFGTRAVVRELRYCESNQILEQLSRIAPKDIDKILEFAVSAFANKKYWSDLFGGQGWSDFAKLLLTISQSLKQYSLAENYETKNKIANEISAYLNVADGMMHNTGSFIDKMIQDETRQHNVSPNYTKQLEEATTLLNAKQLSNPEDILYIIEPYIRNTPEAYEFKELIAAYRSKGNIPDLNRIKRELDEINKHKQILRKYKEEWLPVFS
jgi:hypothetical protein